MHIPREYCKVTKYCGSLDCDTMTEQLSKSHNQVKDVHTIDNAVGLTGMYVIGTCVVCGVLLQHYLSQYIFLVQW